MASRIPKPGQPVRGSETGRPIMALFDLLGRTWAMGIVWQLYDGPQTFRGLQARCDGISAALLNTRLKELRVTGLVTRCDEGYVLTELGQGLSTLLRPMDDWSRQWAKAFEAHTNGAPDDDP